MADLIKIKDVTPEEWQAVNEKNRKMTEEFLAQSLQLSPQTLKQYRSGLMIYWRWVMENADNKAFHEIRSRDYLRYQNYLTTSGLSSSAIKFKRSAVSTFNNYVVLYYGDDDYPMFKNYVSKGIATPAPVAVKEKLPLTLEEYEHLCSELERQGHWQQLAYVRFSFATGARRAEVRQLLKEVATYEGKEITTGTGTMKVYLSHSLRCKGKGKEGKVRKLNFDDVAMDAIKKWLEVRGEDDCPYVFVSMHGGVKQSAENTFNSWADTYFSPIVGRRVHPHLFRESRATTMVVQQGKDIKHAQKLLGHSSSQTTELYVVRKDEDNSDESFT